MSAWGGASSDTATQITFVPPGADKEYKDHIRPPRALRHSATLLYHSLLPPVAGSHVSRVSGPETLGFNYCCTIGATRSNRFLQLLVKHSAQHGLQGQETANKQTSFFFSAVFAACCPPPSIKRKERPGPGPDTRHQTPSDQELPAQPLITISRQTLVN